MVVGKILENSKYAFGYNAQTGEYGDLVAQGVIDPAKVVRCALQDAASVAGLLITTEAMVAELPKKDRRRRCRAAAAWAEWAAWVAWAAWISDPPDLPCQNTGKSAVAHPARRPFFLLGALPERHFQL